MNIAVLGPGGVGGLIAGLLEHAGTPVIVVAERRPRRRSPPAGCAWTASALVNLSCAPARSRRLEEPVDVLIVATKASGLESALGRIGAQPKLVLPLLNGLDHIAVLRERFGADAVLAGTIRVEADRPEPGVVVHTSPFLLIDMACHVPAARAGMEALEQALTGAGCRCACWSPRRR